MPVGLAGVGGEAVLPPALTVLFAQGHVQDPLFVPALVHLLDPGPQVGGALTQAGVLDEVALAGRLHGAAMVPVESVQVEDILMGFLAGIDRTAGVLLPGTALLVQLVLWAWLFLVVLGVHTDVEKLSPRPGCPYCGAPHQKGQRLCCHC